MNALSDAAVDEEEACGEHDAALLQIVQGERVDRRSRALASARGARVSPAWGVAAVGISNDRAVATSTRRQSAAGEPGSWSPLAISTPPQRYAQPRVVASVSDAEPQTLTRDRGRVTCRVSSAADGWSDPQSLDLAEWAVAEP